MFARQITSLDKGYLRLHWDILLDQWAEGKLTSYFLQHKFCVLGWRLVLSRVSVVMLMSLALVFTGCLSKPRGAGSASVSSSSTDDPKGGKVPFTFPGAVSAVNLSDAQIRISWNSAESPLVLTYRIYLLNFDGSLTSLATVPNNLTSYVVSNLSPGTFYNFIVRAADVAGNTDSNSNIVSAITYAGVTNSTVLGSTSAAVIFPAAGDAQGINIYCYTGTSESYTLFASVGSSKTNYTLTGLTKGTAYTCKVLAIAPNGVEDANTATTTFTPSSTPGLDLSFGGLKDAVIQSATGNQVLLTWEAGIGDDIANYRISELGADGLTLTSVITLPKTTTSYLLTGISTFNFHTYVVHALSSTSIIDGNKVYKKVYAYPGPSDAVVKNNIINFPASGDATQGVNIFCKLTTEASYSLTPTATVNSNTATSVTVTGLTNNKAYHCRVSPYYDGVTYPNAGLSILYTTYSGVTGSATTGTTTATVNFLSVNAIMGTTAINIYCKTSVDGTYKLMATLATTWSTSTTLTGLIPGRTYACKAYYTASGVLIDNSISTTFFKTTSLTSNSEYNGVILVQAFGDAPTSPSSPTTKQVRINWNYFGSSSTASKTYFLFRTGAGNAMNTLVSSSCTSAVTSSCLVCRLSNVTGAQTCTDVNVAAAPQKYDYVVVLKANDGLGADYAEELPADDSPYRIRVAIPPDNMVLVHRDSVNYEMCTLMGRTPDPRNNQRCVYSGWGNVPYNSNPGNAALGLNTAYYDFGYSLFVDRWEAACNWGLTSNSTPVGVSALGDVNFELDQGSCHVYDGVWNSANTNTLSNYYRERLITNVPSTVNRRPPLINLSQVNAYKACQSKVDPYYGKKRLLRKREFIAAAAWSTLDGEYGKISYAEAANREMETNHTSVAGTYKCNSKSAAGITRLAFNTSGYELAHDLTANTNNFDAFAIGSVGTKNCVSRFGAQDMVGNVGEWVSDQLGTCSSGTHTCVGITSSLDSGNTDLNNFYFDKTKSDGPGGGTLPVSFWKFEDVPITLGSVLYNTIYFSAPLGMPMITSNGGNALPVSTSGIDFTRLNGDTITLNTDDANDAPEARGLVMGGNYLTQNNSGRWNADYGLRPSVGASTVGFRCALPAE